MFKFVNQVFVGQSSDAAIPANYGDISIIDPNTGAAPTADSNSIQIVQNMGTHNVADPSGATTVQPILRRSDMIRRFEVFTPEVKSIPFAAAIEEQVTVDLSTIVPRDNTRYALRFVFNDPEGTKIQISKSFDYNVVGDASTTTPAMIAQSIANQINRLAPFMLSATVAGAVITVTGVKKADNVGKGSINEYSQYRFKVVFYGSPMDRYGWDMAPQGVVVTETVAPSRGNGTFELVRDAEKHALPYEGYTNFIGFPYDNPGVLLMVKEGGKYDTVIIEYNKLYRSAQAQFQETTPKTVELYVTAGQGDALAGKINDWLQPAVTPAP